MLAGMTGYSEQAQIVWRARAHYDVAAADLRRASELLREAAQTMQWRSKAAEQFGVAATEASAAADTAVSRCEETEDILRECATYLEWL